jgi:hypothetical protein
LCSASGRRAIAPIHAFSAVSHPAFFEHFPNRFGRLVKSSRRPVPPASFQVGKIRSRDVHGTRQLPLGETMLAPDTADQVPGPLMADLRDIFGWQLQSHSKKFAHLADFAKNFPLKIIIANEINCFVTDYELQKKCQTYSFGGFSLEICRIERARKVETPCFPPAQKETS